jgi:hypothetical protein
MSGVEKYVPKNLRSLVNDVPNKAEYQPVELQTDKVLTTDALQEQIEEARKGKAKVDSKYVGFQLEERGHLFDYEFNYTEFLGDISHIIKEGKRRRAERPADMYKENIHMTNSPTTEKKSFD